MAIIKVREADEAALDYLVAQIEKPLGMIVGFGEVSCREGNDIPVRVFYRPSSNWAHGGPIIEREITKLFKNVGGTYTAQIKREIPIRPEDRGTSLATHYIDWLNVAGHTPLIAAMRCYVASKLGGEVDVPDELLGDTP